MFDMKLRFSILGLLIFMLPMLINFVYFVLPPMNETTQTNNVNKYIELVEQVTRILYAIAICILVSDKKINVKSPLLYIGLVFLILYYIVWIRYFVGGRDVTLLSKSFLGIPMPLAIFPVLYYLCEAAVLHNYIAVILMIIFGIAHNIISYTTLYK